MLLVCGLLVGACFKIERLEREAEATGEHEHAKCLSMVGAFVGDEFAARVLTAAADDYDTAEGQASVQRLIHTVWAPDGPSMPSLWLRDRAETILSKTHP
jgi:hypothetical protein